MSVEATNSKTTQKRVFVDMSASLLHHGHIRLLQKAKAAGYVVVALTTDEEILKHKGYRPELDYESRKELLLALKYVDEVIPCPWRLTDEFLKEHNADVLVHSGPNFNECTSVLNLERTEGISSSDMRERAVESIMEKRNSEKVLLTPGPTNLHPQSVYDIRPVFTRNDDEYSEIERRVLGRILDIAGQDSIVTMQGSATSAIEVATTNFLTGTVIVVVSGFYSQRMFDMIERKAARLGLLKVLAVQYDQIADQAPKAHDVFVGADWIVASYTETGDAFLGDILQMRRVADRVGARLMIDATGSINLEPNHSVADVCMFSSCKGLGGLTGASFITYNRVLLESLNPTPKEFMLDLQTFVERKTTAPAHTLCSLDSISGQFEEMGNRVRSSKDAFVKKFAQHLARPDNQPALCTKLVGIDLKAPEWVHLYKPRTAAPDSQVICHLFDQFPSNREIGEVYDLLEVVFLNKPSM